MKLYYLILFIPFISFGQITIDVNDFAEAGDTVRLSTSSLTNIDFSTTGENMNWDFSNLAAESQELKEFKDPNDAGALISFSFGSFADEEYQATNYTESTEIPLDQAGEFLPVTINEVNQFARHTSDSITLLGLSINVEGNDIPVPSDTIETKYVLPLNYGDSYSSRGYTYLNMNPIFNLIWIQYKQRSSTVDGWGTITTPYGTFEALRIKHEINEIDSVFIDLTGTPSWFELPVPPSTEYEWIAKDQIEPILSIRTSLAAGTETVNQVKYKDNYIATEAGIEENTITLNVGPNPVKDQLLITGLSNSLPYTLITSDGKTIQSGTLNPQNGGDRIQLNMISKGIYLIHIGSDSNQFIQRIVKL